VLNLRATGRIGGVDRPHALAADGLAVGADHRSRVIAGSGSAGSDARHR
jgi:hypothetical protein